MTGAVPRCGCSSKRLSLGISRLIRAARMVPYMFSATPNPGTIVDKNIPIPASHKPRRVPAEARMSVQAIRPQIPATIPVSPQRIKGIKKISPATGPGVIQVTQKHHASAIIQGRLGITEAIANREKRRAAIRDLQAKEIRPQCYPPGVAINARNRSANSSG